MTQTIGTQLRDPETGQLPARGTRVRITDLYGSTSEAEIVSYQGNHPGFMTYVVFGYRDGNRTWSLLSTDHDVEVLERAGGLSFEHDVLGVLGRSS